MSIHKDAIIGIERDICLGEQRRWGTFHCLEEHDLPVIQNCDGGGRTWLAGEEQEGKSQSQPGVEFHKVIIYEAC